MLAPEDVFLMLLNRLLDRLNIKPNDLTIYQVAMTHKSYQGEKGRAEFVSVTNHNERLEFLGDAVLDLLLADILIDLFPNENEGSLSKFRASLVNEAALAQVAHKLKLGDVLRMGKGELASQGREKPRLLASAYEALIGAIYKDQGLEFVRQQVETDFKNQVGTMESGSNLDLDYKTKLQETVQAVLKDVPVYEVTSMEGPAHDRTFTVAVKINQRLLATGMGRSKKQAEQIAAQKAMEILKNESGALDWDKKIKTNRYKIIEVEKKIKKSE